MSIDVKFISPQSKDVFGTKYYLRLRKTFAIRKKKSGAQKEVINKSIQQFVQWVGTTL